jgi:hypothetical protein
LGIRNSGKVSFTFQITFKYLVSRTPPLPELPGGVHHRLSANYYTDRDARRSVLPPKSINDVINAPAGYVYFQLVDLFYSFPVLFLREFVNC